MAEIDTLKQPSQVSVSIDFGDDVKPVGRLAERGRKIYFEYDASFIPSGLEISRFSLPLGAGVRSFDPEPFEGLPGVFADSLPDGWGRLLFDRKVRNQGMDPKEISPITRLDHVGAHGPGALVYGSGTDDEGGKETLDLDLIAKQASEVLEGDAEDVLQELIDLNASSAGARPKASIGLNPESGDVIHGAHDLPDGYEHWQVKFANTMDGPDAGAVEYVYSLMARESGVEMPPTRLLPAKGCAGFFATKRFDRDGIKRWHMHTACGLLNTNFRTPSHDYEELLALTHTLTQDVREVEKLFRVAVFNVLAHNRDDHGKNFSWLMDADGAWGLAPAYDLTHSSGPGGEQSTMVMGEGNNPGTKHLVDLGNTAGLDKKAVDETIGKTQAALGKWDELAKYHGVSGKSIQTVARKIAGDKI